MLYVLETAMSFGNTKPFRNFNLEQDFIAEYCDRNLSLMSCVINGSLNLSPRWIIYVYIQLYFARTFYPCDILVFKNSKFESGSEDGVSRLTNSYMHIIFNPLFTNNLQRTYAI